MNFILNKFNSTESLLTTYCSVENPVFIGAGSSDDSAENNGQEITTLRSQVDALTSMVVVIFAFGVLFFAFSFGKKYGIFAKISASMTGLRDALRPRRSEIPVTIADQPMIQETSCNDAGIQENGDKTEVNEFEENTVVEATLMVEDGSTAEDQVEPLAIECDTAKPAEEFSSGQNSDGT